MLTFLHKWRLDHILLGWGYISPFLIFGYPLLGWFAQAYWFLGREIRDNEIHANLILPQQWYLGYVRWTKDSALDFLLPAVVNGLILWVIYGNA